MMTLARGEGISGAVCVRGNGATLGDTVTCLGDCCLGGATFGTIVFGVRVFGATAVFLGATAVGVLGVTTI